MKEDLKKKFKELTMNALHHNPTSFYANLQNIAGLIYEGKEDEYIDKDLKELSDYVQSLSNLYELKGMLRELTPEKGRYRELFHTGLRYEHVNLTHVTVNFPQNVTLSEDNYTIPENLISEVVEKFKSIREYDFNTVKIIAWIKSRLYS